MMIAHERLRAVNVKTLRMISFFSDKQDVDIKWVEYQNMIKYLSQWIKHNVAIMSDRSFPNNPVELKVRHHEMTSSLQCDWKVGLMSERVITM